MTERIGIRIDAPAGNTGAARSKATSSAATSAYSSAATSRIITAQANPKPDAAGWLSTAFTAAEAVLNSTRARGETAAD